MFNKYKKNGKKDLKNLLPDSTHPKIKGSKTTAFQKIALLTVASFSIFQFLLQGIIGILSPQIKAEFNIDATWISFLSSAFYCSYLLMQIPAGTILDMIGVRKTLTFAILTTSLSCFALSLSPNIYIAILLRIIMGMGCSFGFVSMLFSIRLYLPKDKFPLFSSMSEAFSMITAGVANLSISAAVSDSGWRSTMMMLSGVALILLTFTVIFVRSPEVGEEERNHEVNPTEQRAKLSEKLKQLGANFWELTKYKEIWFGGLISGIVFSMVTVFVSLWAVPFFSTYHKLGIVHATSTASTLLYGIALFCPISGLLTQIFKPKNILAFCAFATGICFSFMIYMDSLSTFHMKIIAFVLGATCSGYPISFALVSHAVPHRLQGSALGFTNAVLMLVAPILQLAIGLILSSQHGTVLDGFEIYTVADYRKALSIIPASLVIAFFLCIFGLDSKQRNTIAS